MVLSFDKKQKKRVQLKLFMYITVIFTNYTINIFHNNHETFSKYYGGKFS